LKERVRVSLWRHSVSTILTLCVFSDHSPCYRLLHRQGSRVRKRGRV
jgi:hypothetical protein